jgi:hypothetical protein
MSRRLTLILGLGLAAAGCTQNGSTPPEQIEVKASNDPLMMPRSVLQRYADGQPPSSEVSMFPSMIEEVRKTDPMRADILEKGLAEIQKASGPARAAKAKTLLQQLAPSMTGAPPAENTEEPKP